MQTENEQGLLRRSDALTLEEIQASTDLSGKIASASALAVESKKHSINGTVNSDSFCRTFKFGKVVFLSIYLPNSAFPSNGFLISSGLPRPAEVRDFSDNGGKRLRLDWDGSLKTYFSNADFNGNYSFSGCYITTE